MKQTALQHLIEWGNEMMKEQPMKTLSFAEAIDKAEELLEMEKEQMFDYIKKNYVNGEHSLKFHKEEFEQYYKETYGGGKA
jgi:hypothetical protein